MCQNNDAINDNNKPEDNDDGKIGDNDAPLTPDPSGVLPEMWESVLLVETYLDCGMHLVFCGVVAYCVKQEECFIKNQGLSQQFEQMATTHLLYI
jgi:hypothetical protein